MNQAEALALAAAAVADLGGAAPPFRRAAALLALRSAQSQALDADDIASIESALGEPVHDQREAADRAELAAKYAAALT